jgi:hypothetical protein
MRRIALILLLALGYSASGVCAADDLWVPASTVRFSHEFHVGEEVELECAFCHVAEESEYSDDRLLPTMAQCAECHDVKEQDECILCHLEMENLGKIAVPDREVIFSHKQHAEMEMDCSTCHTGLDRAVKTGGRHLPEMAVCSDCHEGEKAPFECESCHTELQSLRPVSHATGWAHEHGRLVRTGDQACAACHEESDCQECHEGANVSVSMPALGTQTSFAPQSRGDAGLIVKRNHDLNYRFTHAIDAKGKERECATCHEPATFCADCHRPDSDDAFFKPPWHSGPDWGAIAGGVGTGGGRHAQLAKRDMERCAACHDIQGDDPTCMLCHIDRLPGKGNDPKTHGSRFASQVGYGDFHDDPNSLCFSCHVVTGPVGANGFCGYCHGVK